ncbi:Sugar transporter [Mycena sanguinolenta]|uniref:Sugar transporter n=1 Tax=Mycena sanguinolenta TaxID=230812 RepID=A0A8H6Y5Q4_9AGAR|nr:Sugar transporter [Mycena sanguinolenta]
MSGNKNLLVLCKKHRRSLAVAAAVNVGSVLFGFDTGIAGAVVSLSSFKHDFDLATSRSTFAAVSSNIVAVLNAGAFFGALVPPLLGFRLGRRMMLLLAGSFFLVGGILQTASVYPNAGMLYAGRVLAGFGVGIISNTAPVFAAEVSPPELRGLLMSLFELFLVSGGILAYWTTYGCSVHLGSERSTQWRVPLCLQIVLAAIVCLSSAFIVESPRWLARAGRWKEARQVLAYLRDEPDQQSEAVSVELADMKAQIDEELAATHGRNLAEFLTWPNARRLLWGLSVSLLAMWSGHNAILYYGPTVFAEIGFTTEDAALLASGVFTCIKFASTLVFCLGVVQFFSRKTLMAAGALAMSVFLFSLGALLKTHPPSLTSAITKTPAEKGMMACIYLFVVAYSVSWGPLQWIFIGEIFPMRIRDWGMAACACMIWLMNYVVSKIAPIAVENIGWKTWTIFGTMNAVAFAVSLFLPETKDLSLEDMDILFGATVEDERKQHVQMKLKGEEI